MSHNHKPMDPIWMIIVGVLLIVFNDLGEFVAVVAGIVIIILGIRRLAKHHKKKKDKSEVS